MKKLAIILLSVGIAILLGVALGIGLSGIGSDNSAPTSSKVIGDEDGWTDNY